ncbi:hypothetical protein [Edaphobacter bradus]|uniref:hypothetical protein n=1 Tax=Edaphobacter bradus TaxID=2259016 RepID=UPI0021E04E25|nr:hypothetical protein [Edaphobacter bradus]
MRLPLVSGLVFGVLCTAGIACCMAGAQDQSTMHALDGGTRERIQTLTIILPTTNAPFTATVTTELTKILSDGSSQTNWNHRTVARDSSGRIFEERRFFAPNGDKVATSIVQLDYSDPSRHEIYTCRTQEKTCYVSRYYAPESVRMEPAGPLPNGGGSVTREDLGKRMIDDLDVVGSREVTTLNAGVVGNQKTEPIVKEFWYSPRLQINIITKRFDPRFGAQKQNFVVSNINESEPDPKLFEPPADYRVVKMNGQ